MGGKNKRCMEEVITKTGLEIAISGFEKLG
jgi:hypothetical protein